MILEELHGIEYCKYWLCAFRLRKRDAIAMANKSEYVDCVWFSNILKNHFGNETYIYKIDTIKRIFMEEFDRTQDSRAYYIGTINNSISSNLDTILQLYNKKKDEYIISRIIDVMSPDYYSTSFSELIPELMKYDNPFTLRAIAMYYTITNRLTSLNSVDNNCYKLSQMLKRACDLGHIDSLFKYANLVLIDKPEYFTYMGNYIKLSGISYDHFRIICEKIDEFERNPTNKLRQTIFRMGEIVNDQCTYNYEGCYFIYDCSCTYDQYTSACRAISFYNDNIKQTINAINCWTIIATRLNLVKDIRKLISLLLWESRCEGFYYLMK